MSSSSSSSLPILVLGRIVIVDKENPRARALDTCADCGHPIQGYSPIVVHTYTSKHADKPTSTRIICQSCDYFDDGEPYSIFG